MVGRGVARAEPRRTGHAIGQQQPHDALPAIAEPLAKSGYGDYLLGLLAEGR